MTNKKLGLLLLPLLPLTAIGIVEVASSIMPPVDTVAVHEPECRLPALTPPPVAPRYAQPVTPPSEPAEPRAVITT